jgi:hypothetical protein
MTDARNTQEVLEMWSAPNPRGLATVVLLEMWAPGGTTTPRAVMTTALLEQWARVVPPSFGGPMVTMIGRR